LSRGSSCSTGPPTRSSTTRRPRRARTTRATCSTGSRRSWSAPGRRAASDHRAPPHPQPHAPDQEGRPQLMPRRNDIEHILVIGSGPIVIGQACEFDYSGTQACRVLKAEGMRVTLINSNPATIMTDPEFADATYVEPITPEFVE